VQTLNYLTSGGESRALNLGTGQGHSIRQVIAVVEDITGCKVQFRISSQRAGDPAILVADPSLAAKVLGRRRSIPVWKTLLGPHGDGTQEIGPSNSPSLLLQA